MPSIKIGDTVKLKKTTLPFGKVVTIYYYDLVAVIDKGNGDYYDCFLTYLEKI